MISVINERKQIFSVAKFYRRHMVGVSQFREGASLLRNIFGSFSTYHPYELGTFTYFNPFAPGDFAEKRVLKLVERFSGHCRAIKS